MSDKDGEAFDIWWNRFYDEHKETPTSFESWQAGQSEAKALVAELVGALEALAAGFELYSSNKGQVTADELAIELSMRQQKAKQALAALPAEFNKED